MNLGIYDCLLPANHIVNPASVTVVHTMDKKASPLVPLPGRPTLAETEARECAILDYVRANPMATAAEIARDDDACIGMGFSNSPKKAASLIKKILESAESRGLVRRQKLSGKKYSPWVWEII